MNNKHTEPNQTKPDHDNLTRSPSKFCSLVVMFRTTSTTPKPNRIMRPARAPEPSLIELDAKAEAAKVVIAVKAEKVISKTPLAWALTHIVRPGDCITLLAVFPDQKTGKRSWNFPRLAGDCGSSHRERLPDRVCEISESCSQMLLQLHNQMEVRVRIKVVSAANGSVVAGEASRNGANWVVLHKKLKQELKHCMEELHCNIVVMKGSRAKVLRLSLGCSNEIQTPYYSAFSSPEKDVANCPGQMIKHPTPVSSPEETNASFARKKEDRLSRYDTAEPLFLVYEQNPLFERLNKGKHKPLHYYVEYNGSETSIDSDRERLITPSQDMPSSAATNGKSIYWIPQNRIADDETSVTQDCFNSCNMRPPTSRTLFDKFVQYDQDTQAGRLVPSQNQQNDNVVGSSIRHAVSLVRTSSVPPPLCSLCQHNSPVFGKPPRQFSYEELEEATDRFSNMNFLAEGSFGHVYRGVLKDGLVVAVKLLKSGGSQADVDFFREVRVLSCAQQRNVVLLIGFCVDGKTRILVYEYICNGSLDFHLHGNKRESLSWSCRLKLAIGTARGLRYLHEDCRVGCVVHRDLRPNNILVTHDFEPLVSDFGLARWLSECNIGTEEQIIGTSGYIAPEYISGGKITQAVDIYAFGVVILELMTGQRIGELQCYKRKHFLSDCFQPIASLGTNDILTNMYQLLDPSLASAISPEFSYQVQAMALAASLCLRQDPESRPPMSKVLRILERGEFDAPRGLDLNSVGNRSGHLRGLRSHTQPEIRMTHSRKLSH